MQVTSVDHKHFVITNAKQDMTVTCPDKMVVIPASTLLQPGSFDLHIPCQCLLSAEFQLESLLHSKGRGDFKVIV
jgi:hypothetical protein